MRVEAALVGVVLFGVGVISVWIGLGIQSNIVITDGPSMVFTTPLIYLAVIAKAGGILMSAIGATLTVYGAVGRQPGVLD